MHQKESEKLESELFPEEDQAGYSCNENEETDRETDQEEDCEEEVEMEEAKLNNQIVDFNNSQLKRESTRAKMAQSNNKDNLKTFDLQSEAQQQLILSKPNLIRKITDDNVQSLKETLKQVKGNEYTPSQDSIKVNLNDAFLNTQSGK